MHKARHWIVPLVLLITVLTLAAVTFAKPIEVVFWHPFDSGTPRTAVEGLVDRYNASQSEIIVSAHVVPDLIEKVKVAIVAGTPPDVATNLYPWREGAIGMLTDLTPLAERDGFDLAQEFFPAGIAESYYKGHLYGLPWFHVVHPVLYYRVDAYEEAGLDANAPPTTWEQLHDYSRYLTRREADGRVSQFSFDWGPGAAEHAFPMYYRVAGGEYLDPSGTEVIANNTLARHVLNWLVDVRLDIQADLAASSGTFYNRGRVHMINGNWVATSIRSGHPHLEPGRDWAMAPFPVPEGSPQNTVMSSRFMAIPTGAKNTEAAWEFIKWLTGPEASRQYALERGLLPAHRDAVADAAFADTFLFWEVQQAMLNQGIPEWGSVPIPDLVHFLGLMQEAYGRAQQRSTSPDAALEDATRRMQAFLNEHL